MNNKRILKLINEIGEMDVKVFGVLGGEPFVRKKVLLESMKRIKKHGIAGSLVTNGTLLEEKDVEKIVRMRWDLIRFSIDGLRETHDYLRGMKGSFDKVIKSIKMFHRIKKRLNSNFPTLEVNFVLTNQNCKELEPLIKKLSAYEINFVYVLPLIELTEESKKLKITEKEASEAKEFLRKAEEISKECGIKSNIREIIEKNLFLYSNKMENIILEDKKKLIPCFLPWYTININSDGFVTPCAQWPKSEGIELNEKSLKKVWFEDFEKMRKMIKHNLPQWCSRCCVPLVDENKDIRKKLTEE
jgi:MoaA/NifB/PqqE/SkfB family radical SAM enzyme